MTSITGRMDFKISVTFSPYVKISYVCFSPYVKICLAENLVAWCGAVARVFLILFQQLSVTTYAQYNVTCHFVTLSLADWHTRFFLAYPNLMICRDKRVSSRHLTLTTLLL